MAYQAWNIRLGLQQPLYSSMVDSKIFVIDDISSLGDHKSKPFIINACKFCPVVPVLNHAHCQGHTKPTKWLEAKQEE